MLARKLSGMQGLRGVVRVRCQSIANLSRFSAKLSASYRSPTIASSCFYHNSARALEPDSDTSMAQPRPKLRIGDVLKSYSSRNFTISHNASINDAINHLVTEKLSSALVTGANAEVVGIFTARDLLKFISQSHHGSNRNLSATLIDTKITEIITKREKLVYCSPTDSVRHCREIMFQTKIRNLPVIDGEEVKGIVTMKILADSAFDVGDIGGKKGFIHNVTGRRGVPDTAKVTSSSSSTTDTSNLTAANTTTSLDLEVGAYALPHPYKHDRGVAIDRRGYGAFELSTDMSLCEDAHFAIRVKDMLGQGQTSPSDSIYLPLSAPNVDSRVYLAVADGVGSWRQYGVDPRDYSHSLIENARQIIEVDFAQRALIGHSPFDRDLEPIHPLDVIVDAWNVTSSEGINGSSTICVATLDKKHNQLSYSNIGDCGLIVLRHIDSHVAGYMRERQLPRHLRKNDLRIAYLSQQQLQSFNLPYQLGFSNIPGAPARFETPSDADTASIPIMPGDLIIMGTDGLFDNLDLNEIVDIVVQWEKENFPSASGANDGSIRGHSAMQLLAEKLVKTARELSLDTSRDGPFAVLAKENDIMWGGGMPDDTTVVVARVIRPDP